MNKRKICWITPDYFVDCDLNYFNMHEILRHYDIHWIVLFSKNNRFKEADFEQIRKENTNLTIEFFRFNNRIRNPKNIFAADFASAYNFHSRHSNCNALTDLL